MTSYRARMDGFVAGVSIGIVVVLCSVMAAAIVALLQQSESPIVNIALGASILFIVAMCCSPGSILHGLFE